MNEAAEGSRPTKAEPPLKRRYCSKFAKNKGADTANPCTRHFAPPLRMPTTENKTRTC